jgi:eukaryotic-like serine/threonine-protein kinase
MQDPKDGPVRGTTSASAKLPPPANNKVPGAVQTPTSDLATQIDLPESAEMPTILEVRTPFSSGEAPTSVDLPRNSKTGKPASATGPASFIQGGILLQPGTLLGNRYEIVQLLGEGGMGAVYKANDQELERVIALKVIRPDLSGHPEILKRFKQELILARQVTDTNIIRIFDLGEADGIRFITMEFVEGETLHHMLRARGKLPVDEVVSTLEQVLSGLRAAHKAGVIHRDLKPGNIMRDEQGRVVIMDFGLARSLEGDGMTKTGAMLGTMEYMSPEQALGAELDARSDLFTVGLICYELLTGRMPFHADSAVASLLRRTKERAVPMTEHDRDIPGVLSNIISKCLERDPALRYQSAQAVLDDLQAWRGGGGKAKVSASSVSLLINRLREISWARLTLVAVAALLAAVLGWYLEKTKTPVQAQHAPVSVLVADFENATSDPVFDGTLEPMFNVALEGASFINAFNRGSARQLAQKLPNATNKLDENTARLVAVNQGVAAIITGSLSPHASGYQLSVKVVDAMTGKILATDSVTATDKDELLLDVPKAAAPIRKALGDNTPESVQIDKLAGAFSTSSLVAVHEYGGAMEQLWAGNSEEAVRRFPNAIAADPNFARAYGGMASAYGNLGRTQEMEKYVKLAMQHVDRMTERERYRVRGLYYYVSSDYPKCIEEYGELVKRFPADNIAWGNMASCYMNMRKVGDAVAAVKQAVEITPKGALQRLVLSFYTSYNGDFSEGEKQARTALELNPSSSAYLALAEAQLGEGQITQATETYQKLQKLNAASASSAASGLANIAAYEGRYAEAVRILDEGIAGDLNAKDADDAAEKLVGLAHVQALRSQKAAAVAAASKALSMSQSVPVRVMAARTFIEAGETAKAQGLASTLASETQLESQAYAKIIDGGIALQRGDKNQAIKLLTDANALLDTWIGRFDLGRAYLEAGLFVEADSEFDRCIKRRGEALELFMDDFPTFAYFPATYYYQGRVREGLKSPGFAEPYQAYLSIRGRAGEDPFVADIHRRLGR